VLALAESLVSKVKAAEWRDRAEAAVKAGDDLVMRDLRSLVNGSDVARDEASRDMVIALREMLESRVEAHRVSWANEVAVNLDDGHIVRALRLSSHPPDPAARFSAELATRLRDAASIALASDTPRRDGWPFFRRSWRAPSGVLSSPRASPTTRLRNFWTRRASSAVESRLWLLCSGSACRPLPAQPAPACP